jgi:dihydropteroate synthase
MDTHQQLFEKMLILNITPNSFSDGGVIDSSNTLLNIIQKALTNNVNFFDIGAESTAPMNQGISKESELGRWESFFFPILNKINQLDPLKLKLKISLDTYKIEILEILYHHIRNALPKNIPLYFNDVCGLWSGDDGEKLAKFLSEVYHDKNDMYFYVIRGHSRVEKRSETSKHKEFCLNEEDLLSLKIPFVQLIGDYFQQGVHTWCETWKFPKRNLIFDAGIGFSKTKEQNYLILDYVDQLLLDPVIGINQFRWCFGLSKKSFMHLTHSKTNLEYLERVHEHYLHHILRSLNSKYTCTYQEPPLIFRVHPKS